MVRLMLTLTPVVCMLGGIALNVTFDHFFAGESQVVDEKPAEKQAKVKARVYSQFPSVTFILSFAFFKSCPGRPPRGNELNIRVLPLNAGGKAKDTEDEEEETPVAIKVTVLMALTGLLCQYAVHCTYITSNYYSSPSVVLASNRPDGSRNIIDDYREAYYWLRTNTKEDATIMSWWDYGYQISGMANRTTLVDNNTWNNSHIAMVGRAMASNEDDAYDIMQNLGVDYVLVIFGGMLGKFPRVTPLSVDYALFIQAIPATTLTNSCGWCALRRANTQTTSKSPIISTNTDSTWSTAPSQKQ